MHKNGWHRALDVQLDLHKWLLTDNGKDFTTGVLESLFASSMDEDKKYEPYGADHYGEIFTEYLTRVMWRGDTMFITSDMMHVAMQAAEDLPEELVFDPRICLSNQGFILFEESIVGEDRRMDPMVVNALAWGIQPILIIGQSEPVMTACIYTFTDIADSRDAFDKDLLQKLHDRKIYIPITSLLHMFPMREGDEVGSLKATMPGQALITDVVKLFCAIQLLSHQSIGEVVRVPPNRAQRRRYERDYHQESDRMITLITLRRKSMPNGKEPKDVPWTRRWIVRGHWRHQWYPKSKTNEWKYIHEYIKGPEDKPLVTGRRVFNFRR